MPGEGLTHGPPAEKKAGGSHHRFSRTSGIPCAVVLTLIRDLPGDRLIAPVCDDALSQARCADLSTGRSGPHDFTSESRGRSSHGRDASTASPPHVSRRSAETSLLPRRVSDEKASISEKEKEEYFHANGWTVSRALKTRWNLVFCRGLFAGSISLQGGVARHALAHRFGRRATADGTKISSRPAADRTGRVESCTPTHKTG